MNDRVVLPIATPNGINGKRSWNLPGGVQIAAITIDNPSGSWLKILQDDTFIPPYTMGYGHNFHPTITQVDVVFVTGPVSQVSTQQGDNPTLIIWDSQVAETLGNTDPRGFIDQFTPVISSAVVFNTNGSAAITTQIFAAVANKRYRILTTSVAVGFFTNAGGLIEPQGGEYDLGIGYAINSSGPPVKDLIWGRINPTHPESVREFSNGFDCPMSGNIQIICKGVWGPAVQSIGAIVTAQLI